MNAYTSFFIFCVGCGLRPAHWRVLENSLRHIKKRPAFPKESRALLFILL